HEGGSGVRARARSRCHNTTAPARTSASAWLAGTPARCAAIAARSARSSDGSDSLSASSASCCSTGTIAAVTGDSFGLRGMRNPSVGAVSVAPAGATRRLRDLLEQLLDDLGDAVAVRPELTGKTDRRPRAAGQAERDRLAGEAALELEEVGA